MGNKNLKKNLLLAPNSFKESADSITITNILTKELNKNESLNIIQKPLSDGGDGFLSVCEKLFNGIRLSYFNKNNYDNNLNSTEALYSYQTSTIYIESAEIVGLKKIPQKFRNPLNLNTAPLGNLIIKITDDINNKKLNVNNLIIGIGGTATVDFGLGLLSCFGAKLLDSKNKVLEPIPSNFSKTKELIIPDFTLPFSLRCVSDVVTPLFGDNNALELYSKQKGATLDQLQVLKEGFSQIYNLLYNNGLIKFDKVLNGAGGGLAAGLEIFFDAEIIGASDFINEQILFDIIPDKIDYVITGEGAFDRQSLENKGAYIVLNKFRDLNTKIYLVCGTIEKSLVPDLPENVTVIELQKFFNSVDESIKNFEKGLKIASDIILNHLKN